MNQFYHYVLSHFLEKHHRVKIQSNNIASLLFIIYYSQLISVTNLHDRQNYFLEMNLLNIFQYYGRIWRPYSYLLIYENFRLYAFIIPTLIILILSIDFIIQWIEEIRSIQNNSINNSNKITKIRGEKILSIIFQIHLYTISLYEIDLFLISIKESVLNVPIKIGILAISLTFLICKIVFILLTLICSESLHFPSSPMHFNLVSPYQFINILFIVISIYLNTFNDNFDALIKHGLNLVIIAIYIFQEVQKEISHFRIIALIILACGFFYNLTFFFISQIPQQNYQISLFFALCPLFLNLVICFAKFRMRIDYSKNRNLGQIFQNLLILYQFQKSKSQINTLEIALLKQLNRSDDPFSSELKLFNNKLIKAKDQKTSFWYLKYILIKLSLMQYIETLILIYNFRSSFLFSEKLKQYVKMQGQINFLQKLKLQNLSEEVYQTLNYNITNNSDIEKLNTTKYVMHKISLQKLQASLAKIFEDKLKLYQKIIENKQHQKNLIYNQCYSLTSEALIISENLKNELNSLKTYRIQQLLIILYVEFFNNVLQAELLKYCQLQNEELKQFTLENMDFIHLKLKDNLVDWEIFYVSQHLVRQLDYTQHDCKSDTKIFFADSFIEYHQQVIKTFLQNGCCKFLNKSGDVVIRGNNFTYFQAEFQLNIENTNQPKLAFFAFIKIIQNQSLAVYLNENFLIIGYSQPFKQLLLSLDISLKQIYQTDIKSLIMIDDASLNESDEKIRKTFLLKNQDKIFLYTITQRKGLIELVLVEDTIDFTIVQEKIENSRSISLSLKLNEESFVAIPKMFSCDDLNTPLSIMPKGITSQEFLQKGPQRYHTVQSCNSPKNSEPAKNFKKHLSELSPKEKDIDNDQASSKFSRGFLDNSIYYSKYNKLILFLAKSTKMRQLYIGLAFLVVAFGTNVLFQLINSLQFLPKLVHLTLDTELLAIKGNFMAPVHNCVTAQACVVDYMTLIYLTEEVSKEIGYNKLSFAMDSINKSYDQLKNCVISQVNNDNMQEYFYGKNITMQQIEKSGLVSREISLKNALLFYLQAQYYISIEDYYNVFTISASPEFIFYMANIKVIDDYMNTLNDEIKQQVINNVLQFETDETKFYLKMLFIEILVFSFGLSLIMKNQQFLSKQFNLFTDLNNYALFREMHRQQKIISILHSDDAHLVYNFDVTSFEKDIQEQQPIFDLKINQTRIKYHKYSPPRAVILGLYFAILIIYIVPSFVVQNESSEFFTKYEASAQLLVDISEVSSAVSAIYEMREINYMISDNSPFFDFFTDQKRIEQNTKILNELDKISHFLSSYNFYDYNKLLVTDQFQILFQDMQKGNLCNYLVHYNQTLAEQHCIFIYDGVMKLGLINTLNEIHQIILTEYEATNGFQQKLRNKTAPFEEVEIGLITSDAIYYLYNEILSGIKYKTQQLVGLHQVLVGVYITLSIFFTFSLFCIFYPKLLKKAIITKNMIFLVPKLQFYLDQKFDTDFRLLSIL